jgi:CheY-like chemotaxis protein
MEVVGRLAGGVAHNFNNILAAIVGFSELLIDALTNESKERAQARRILQAALRGRDVVRQLLTFSRQADLEKTQVALVSLIKETLNLIRASLPSTISVELDIGDTGTLVVADPIQIQQIILNLTTNAAYAMREKGGNLTIGLSHIDLCPDDASELELEPGKYVKMWVEDTGTGIGDEIREKIFDPFFTTKPIGQGTGLGLSTVHGIVKSCSGAIKVETACGLGSTFAVFLPMADTSVAPVRRAPDDVPLGTGRILFVDDEESLVEIGTEMLEDLGYTVTGSVSSAKALALFTSDPDAFDLVITDQTMPDFTGLDLAREFASIRSDVPVILVTGFSHLVDAGRARQAGIRAFLMKPLTKGELARTVRDVLATEKESSVTSSGNGTE